VPKFIYRYKYLPDGDGLRAVIGERTLKFTHPQKFNDPFDCMPVCEIDLPREISKIHPQLREALHLDGLSAEELHVTLSKAESGMRVSFENGDFITSLLSGASVLSLSKIPDSTLMWSHYAEDHKGAVVEFRIDCSKKFSLGTSHADLICLDVHYSRERPVMLWDGNPSAPNTVLENLILTKSDVWAYEQESRVLKSYGGEGIFKYDPTALSAVVLGARNENQEELVALVGAVESSLNQAIPVYQAKFCGRTYRLNIPGFKYRTDQSAHPEER
jgi:hypothetical protein